MTRGRDRNGGKPSPGDEGSDDGLCDEHPALGHRHTVVAALVPAIHASLLEGVFKPEMPGTRPGMTREDTVSGETGGRQT